MQLNDKFQLVSSAFHQEALSLWSASMRRKIVPVGADGVWVGRPFELTIDKDMERLSAGQIGFSRMAKAIMAHLQRVAIQSAMQGVRFNEPHLHGLRGVPTDQGLQQAQDTDGVRPH